VSERGSGGVARLPRPAVGGRAQRVGGEDPVIAHEICDPDIALISGQFTVSFSFEHPFQNIA